MTVPAQAGIFGFALQIVSGKVGQGGTFTPASETWYKMRAPRVALGTVQDLQVFPPEVGGLVVPTGTYKQGHFFGGDVDILPRAENNIGWLLRALMGDASTTNDVDHLGAAQTGLDTHIFRFDPASSYNQDWVAIRCEIPGGASDGTDDYGETGYDCKIAAARFIIPNQGKILMRLSILGRDTIQEEDPTFTFSNADFEDNTTVPDAGRGSFKIAGTEYPLLSVTIDMINGLTDPGSEIIIGDFTPEDFVALTRGMTIRIVYKYDNPDLYQQALNNGAALTDWSETPFSTVTAGAVPAFEAIFQAAKEVGATGIPYGLIFRAGRVDWSVDGPPELNAGGFLTQAFTGTVIAPVSGVEYAEIILENDVVAGY